MLDLVFLYFQRAWPSALQHPRPRPAPLAAHPQVAPVAAFVYGRRDVVNHRRAVLQRVHVLERDAFGFAFEMLLVVRQVVLGLHSYFLKPAGLGKRLAQEVFLSLHERSHRHEARHTADDPEHCQ